MHRKVWLNLGAAIVFLTLTIMSPLIPDWKLALVVQTYALVLYLGFLVAGLASAMYFEKTTQRTV